MRRKQTYKRQKRKTRKQKQKGGFAPSIAGGLANALSLAPLAIRAGIELLRRKQKKTRKNR